MSMSYQKRLDQAFENVPVLPLDDNHKYVVFSDCHRGSGNNNDNFIKNEHLYLAALRHYNRMQYTYVELGDGDELWENRKMEQILEVHNRAFEQLALFYRDDRLYMVYGNHDMVKKNASFCNKKCQLFYSVTSPSISITFLLYFSRILPKLVYNRDSLFNDISLYRDPNEIKTIGTRVLRTLH